MQNGITGSIRSSLRKNGVMRTFNLIYQYFKSKRSRKDIFPFRISRNIDDIFIRPTTSDFSVLRQVFMNYEYGFDLPDNINTIIDAGANIGVATIYFASRFPQARIIAMEPEPSNFDLLVRNTKRYKGVTPVHYALWNRNTQLNMVDEGYDKWGMQTREIEESTSSLVNAITLEYLLEHHKIDQIDLLKIDIEGAEFELFEKGAEKWLRHVRVLVIELHEHLKPGCTAVFLNAISSIRHRVSHSGENVIVFNLDLL